MLAEINPTLRSTINAAAMKRLPWFNVILGIALVVASLVLLVVSPRLTSTLDNLLIGLSCLAVFILSDLLSERIEYGTWASYLNLSAMVAWLSLGLAAGLGVVVVGVTLSSATRYLFQYTRLRADFTLTNTALARHSMGRVVITGGSLLAAAGVYALLDGVVPLQEVTPSGVLMLISSLSVGFVMTQVLGVRMAWWLGRAVAQPIWSNDKRDRWLSETLLLALIAPLAALSHQADTSIFMVIMASIAAHAVRRWQAVMLEMRVEMLMEQHSSLAQKLALVNLSIQNAMFNIDQPEAIKTACETAIALAQANKAAIFLIDREHETLRLVESIGLTEAHRRDGRDLPYRPEEFSLAPRIITDTDHSQDIQLREFAQRGNFRAFLEIPLRSSNVMLGYLVVYHNRPHEYSQTDLHLIELLTNQLTAALDNAQLIRSLEVHTFEMIHLVQLSRIAAESLDSAKVAEGIAAVLQQMTQMDWVMVTTVEDRTRQMKLLAAIGNKNQHGMKSIAAFPETLKFEEKEPYPVFFQKNDASIELQQFMTARQVESLLLLPLAAHDKLIGAVFLGAFKGRIVTEREIQLLAATSNQIATQLHNVLVYRDTHIALAQQIEQLSLIESIMQQISGSYDFNLIIDEVFNAAVQTTHADGIWLALHTTADDFWVTEQIYRNHQNPERNYWSMKRNQGLMGETLASGKPQFVADLSQYPNPDPSPYASTYRSALSVPLATEANRVIGVLKVASFKPNFFSEEQACFLKNLGAHALISIENGRLLDELQYQITTLGALRELAVTLSSADEITAVAKVVSQSALEIVNANFAALYRYAPQEEDLYLLGDGKSDGSLSPHEEELIAFAKIAHRVALTAEAQTFEDMTRLLEHGLAPSERRYQSAIAIPILRGYVPNEILLLGYQEAQVFDDRLLNTLNLLSAQVAGHLDNAILHERIRDGNNRMRAILDSARDGIIMLSMQGHLTEFNPAAQRLIGLPLSDYVGESFVSLLLKNAERTEETMAGYSREELQRLARIQRLEPEGITRREFSRTLPNGKVIYIEEIGAPVFDEDNRMVGRMLALRDISEQKTIEQYRDDITRMAYHDLRAPLQSAILAIRTTQEELAEEGNFPIIETTLNAAMTSANNMMNLVESLLTIHKGNAMTLERVPVKLTEVIQAITWTLRASIEKAKINLTVNLPDTLPAVNVDYDKMMRVVQNLVDNAIRYSPTGGEIRIWATHDLNLNKVVLRINDAGPGIPEKDRERIFEQFWQVKENKVQRGSKGSGIGLAFCLRVVQAHGEKIWVENKSKTPLTGACFAFTLPPVQD